MKTIYFLFFGALVNLQIIQYEFVGTISIGKEKTII